MKITLDKTQLDEAIRAYLPTALRMEAIDGAAVTFHDAEDMAQTLGSIEATVQVVRCPDKRRRWSDVAETEAT